MIAETEIRLPADAYDDARECTNRLARRLGVAAGAITHHVVVRRSLDARKGTLVCVLRVRVWIDEPFRAEPAPPRSLRDVRGAPPAVVVGAGPAGLFAALTLIERGLRPIVLERGADVRGRRHAVARIARAGIVDPENNYCFGEGGAGTFSDGKLYTRATKRGSIRDVLDVLVHHGAPPDVLIDAHPHVGTNRLPQVVQAVGVRVEHPQALVDQIQYRCTTRPRGVPAASYALVRQVNGRGVFSFCMCPGGVICPAATSGDEVVVNGWSPSSRGLGFANAGMVVEVTPDDLAPHRTEGVLAGIAFQTALEHAAYVAGGGGLVAPAQRLVDFVEGRASSDLPRCSYRPGINPVNLHELLPPAIGERLRAGFRAFGRTMRGYLTNEAVVVGVETRTSSPVRIPRDPTSRMHPQASGLFPCGEGAGYAGGIMSAALDGQHAATALADGM